MFFDGPIRSDVEVGFFEAKTVKEAKKKMSEVMLRIRKEARPYMRFWAKKKLYQIKKEVSLR